MLQVNFGDVKIPRNFDYPKPQKIGALSGVHGVSSDNIVIVDAQTLLIPNFSYDGEAPGKIIRHCMEIFKRSLSRQASRMFSNKVILKTQLVQVISKT